MDFPMFLFVEGVYMYHYGVSLGCGVRLSARGKLLDTVTRRVMSGRGRLCEDVFLRCTHSSILMI